MSTILRDFERVSRRLPCPVCGNSKSWCLVSRDRSVVMCPRVESGKFLGEVAGYLHRIGEPSGDRVARRQRETEPRRDFAEAASILQHAATNMIVKQAAVELGVSFESLKSLGVGYHAMADAMAYPMWDSLGIAGIRFRAREPDEDGRHRKYSAIGTHGNGVFLAHQVSAHPLAVIVEGPTDAAAAITLGFARVYGRPFCRGGNREVAHYLAHYPPDMVVIIPDNDEPGKLGAGKLADELCGRYDVRVVPPPDGVKDVRAWLAAGVTKADVVERAGCCEPWRVE